MTAPALPSPPPQASPQRGRLALSACLGAGFTFCLFWSIAQLENYHPAPPPEPPLDLQMAVLQMPPPPPPRETPAEPAEPVTIDTGILAESADSPVKISVNPPNLNDLLPPTPVAPPARIQVTQLYTELRPKVDLSTDDQHVYQQNDVDQQPGVLYRVLPNITQRMAGGASRLTVSILMIIDEHGVGKVIRLVKSTGIPAADELVTEDLPQWTFSPAIRRGKRVKIMLVVPLIFQFSSPSRFEA